MQSHFFPCQQLPSYLLREGTSQAELEEAVDSLRSLSEKELIARFQRGQCYEGGRGVVKDYAQAAPIDLAQAATLKREGQAEVERRTKLWHRPLTCETNCCQLGGSDD